MRGVSYKGNSQTRNRSSKITAYLQILPRPTANPNIDKNPSQGLLHFALSGSSDVWTLRQELLVLAWAYFCMPVCWKASATESTVLVSSRCTLHRGAFCQFLFQWIYYYGSNKSNGKETGKTHLCEVWCGYQHHWIFSEMHKQAKIFRQILLHFEIHKLEKTYTFNDMRKNLWM